MEKTYELNLKLTQLSQDFGEKINAVDHRCETDGASSFNIIETDLSKICFVYTLDKVLLSAPSRLSVRIYPIKNNPCFFCLSELQDDDDFRCTVFPDITNEEKLVACFSFLSDIVIRYLPKTESIVLTDGLFENLVEEKTDELERIFKCRKSSGVYAKMTQEEYIGFLFNMHEAYIMNRMSDSKEYIAFLKGDLARAEKCYRKIIKKGAAFDVDKRIYEFIRSGKATGYRAAPDSLLTHAAFNKKSSGKTDFKVYLFSYAVSTAFLCLITFVISLVRSRGTVLYLSGYAYIIPPIISLILAFTVMATFRRAIIKLIMKNAQDELDKDAIVNSKRANKFYSYIFEIVLILCIYATVFFARSPAQFYADKIVIASALNFPTNIERTVYRYEDISAVYHIDGRHNSDGDYIPRGSYILVFKNGDFFDLDNELTDKTAREKVIPIIESYVEKIEYLDSDLELPI